MKRILTFVLVLSLVCMPLSAFAYSDVTDASMAASIAALERMGVVSGFPDGTFRLGSVLTRAQFCKMAMAILGVTNVSGYTGVTVYPDVRTGHWAQGYINAAVQYEIAKASDSTPAVKLISGFPDGTFRPDQAVTFAQAVTILMRILGYTDADVGMNWPRSYLSRAEAVGLTSGVSLRDSDSVTRENGVKLFYNLLFTKTFVSGKQDKEFLYSKGVTEKLNSILLNASAESEDGSGKTGALFTTGFFPSRTPLSKSLQGYRGRLLVDEEGYVLSFTPSAQTPKAVVVDRAGALSITSRAGETIAIPASATVYVGVTEKKYSALYLDMPAGQSLRIFYTSSGTVDYLLMDDASAASGNIAVVLAAPKKDFSPGSLFGGAASSAAVYKNGLPVTAADICQYDSLVYSPVTNTIQASDNHFTGLYEYATPNAEAPESITVGGLTLTMSEVARNNMPSVSLGERVAVILTFDGRVASVLKDTSVPSSIGLVSGKSGSYTVNTTGGWKVDGISIGGDEALGQLATISSSVNGKLGAGGIGYRATSYTAHLDLMLLGNTPIAGYCKFFERAGAGGFINPIESSDILNKTVPANKIAHVGYDSNGRVNVLVFEDLTGAGYKYGFAVTTSDDVPALGGSYTVSKTTLRSADGTTLEMENNPPIESISYGTVVGIMPVRKYGNASVGAVVPTTRYQGIRRNAFSGNESVRVDGQTYQIPKDLQVWVESLKDFKSVQEARGLSDNFEVYVDRPASQGGKARFIVAK